MDDLFDLETIATVNANDLITQLWYYVTNRRCRGISFLLLLLLFTSGKRPWMIFFRRNEKHLAITN